MEMLIAALLGLITTWLVQKAKQINVSPRIVIAGIAGILGCIYFIALMLMGKTAIDEILQKMLTGLAIWYSTSTFVYEWIIKFIKFKDTPAG
jgi:hypothetical protein